jgi:hypothetical protein
MRAVGDRKFGLKVKYLLFFGMKHYSIERLKIIDLHYLNFGLDLSMVDPSEVLSVT